MVCWWVQSMHVQIESSRYANGPARPIVTGSTARLSTMPRQAVSPSSELTNEAALLERLRAGDGPAFEYLVRTCGGPMMAAAKRLLRSDDDAADAVQEAFISAFKALDRFEGTSKLSTWLHRIAVNAALMKLRSRRRNRRETCSASSSRRRSRI